MMSIDVPIKGGALVADTADMLEYRTWNCHSPLGSASTQWQTEWSDVSSGKRVSCEREKHE